MKVCSKCGEDKELTEFYNTARGIGGVARTCKVCCRIKCNEYHKANREDNLVRMNRYRESHKEERKEYDDKNRESIRHRNRNWGRSNRLKTSSQTKALRALKKGIINRETSCSKCGSNYLVQMHHEDYDKPLDVVFLCKYCHMQRHSEMLA
jgi:hypothetical protein